MVLPKEKKEQLLEEDYSLNIVLKKLKEEEKNVKNGDFDFKYKKRFFKFAEGKGWKEDEIQKELDKMDEDYPETPDWRKRLSKWKCHRIGCLIPENKNELHAFREVQMEYLADKMLDQDERLPWTIDLCFILTEYDVPYTFESIKLSVDEDYKDEGFYEEFFQSNGEDRIKKRFNDAREKKFKMTEKEKGVEFEDIKQHVLNKGPAIVLVNANKLNCGGCRWHRKTDCLKRFDCVNTDEYLGHFIV